MNRRVFVAIVAFLVGCAPGPEEWWPTSTDLATLEILDDSVPNYIAVYDDDGYFDELRDGTVVDRTTGEPFTGFAFAGGPWPWHARFVNGVMDGPMEQRHASGWLKARASLREGRLDGVLETYHENGMLEQRGTFVRGKLSGLNQTFYDDGQLSTTGNWVDGERQGVGEAFHRNGQLSQRATWVNGRLQGPAEQHREDGSLIEHGSWNGDEKCGEWVEEGERKSYPACPVGGDSTS